MTHKDYEIEVWKDGKMWETVMIDGITEEILEWALEELRSNYPGCETRVFEIVGEWQGGTYTVESRKAL